MKSESLRLFKALPVKSRRKKNPPKDVLDRTIKKGYLISPEVWQEYGDFPGFLDVIEKDIGLSGEDMNSTFHKSWSKVRDSDMELLVAEQMIHYLTTYGFEALGIYDENSVYIPNEKLEVPELEDNIPLIIVRGLTKEELKDKLSKFLQSGIALKEETKNDIVVVAMFVELDDIENVNNKEVRIMLYDYLNKIPSNAYEFVRYLVFKTTQSSLVIKNKDTIDKIKANSSINTNGLLERYCKMYGEKKLAEVFNRYKPIFLALRFDAKSKKIINKISRLSKTEHKPMKQDFLNNVTANLDDINLTTLNDELKKVNVFRKIRLAYALNYRSNDDINSIMYKIRNGKAFAKSYSYNKQKQAKKVLKYVIRSIAEDVEKNVKGKKVFIPENVKYALPATEKQFTGNFPSGTCITTPKDTVFGVYWKDVGGNRIDIDLSLLNAGGKYGWDSQYRDDNKSILFSGDITSASKGATELFYVKQQTVSANLMLANYYNYEANIPVPIKILVGQEKLSNLDKNHMIDPNKLIASTDTVINVKQKNLGIIVTTSNENRFYFCEVNVGNNISSSDNEHITNIREYLFKYYSNTLDFKDILEKAGAKFVDDPEKADIDLSVSTLERDTIINLLS